MNTVLRNTRVLRAHTHTLGCRTSAPRRTLITLKEKTIYHAHATANNTKSGGTVAIHSSGNELAADLLLSYPKSVGGTGKGHNPEQLLAAGHAACLLQVLQDIAQRTGRTEEIKDVKIHAEAVLGTPVDRPGWGFQVNIKFEGVEQDLIDATHEACPFSRMEKEGIVVNVSKA